MVNRLIALNTKHFSDKQKTAAMSQIFVPVRKKKRTGCHSSALTTQPSRTTIGRRTASSPRLSPL